MPITKQILLGLIFSSISILPIAAGSMIINDYKDYRKAHGKLEYMVFTLGSPNAVATYENQFHAIETKYKNRFWY